MSSRAQRLALFLALVIVLPACAGAERAVGAAGAESAVGIAAPAFTLKDADGKVHDLAKYKGKVVVLEWINPNCPFSRRHAEEGTMTRLAAAHPEVVWLAVNSTAKDHKDFLTPQAQSAYAREHKIAYPILYDTDGATGKAYAAATTPHMYVIDQQGKLIYRGAIDNEPYGRADKRKNYVEAALAAHKAGQPIAEPSTKPYGCSVKYGG